MYTQCFRNYFSSARLTEGCHFSYAFQWNYIYACTTKSYDILKVMNALVSVLRHCIHHLRYLSPFFRHCFGSGRCYRLSQITAKLQIFRTLFWLPFDSCLTQFLPFLTLTPPLFVTASVWIYTSRKQWMKYSSLTVCIQNIICVSHRPDVNPSHPSWNDVAGFSLMLVVDVLVVPSNYWGEQLKIDSDRFFPSPAQLVEIIADWKSCKLNTSIN